MFCGYFFCASKWIKNIKNIKRKSQNFPKNNDSPKNRKKERGKRGTISRGAHREAQSELCLRVLSGSLFVLLFPSTILVFLIPITLLSTILLSQPGTCNTLDQQREQVLWTIIQHYFLLLTCVPDIHITLCLPSKLHKFFRSVQTKGLAISVPLPHRYHKPAAGCTAHCLHW